MREKLISLGKKLVHLIGLIRENNPLPAPAEEHEKYLQDVDKARREWQLALHNFNFYAANDLIDYGVYQINAAEKKYMHLLKEARAHNVTAETYTLYREIQRFIIQ